MQTVSRRRALGIGACLGVGGLSSLGIAGEAQGPNPVVGAWTYRSFINDPDPNTPFGNLQFAEADLRFDEAPFGQVVGRLTFGDDYLALKGTITYGNPFTLRYQGVGATPGTIEQGKPWIYDYLAFVAPAWPNGIDQRPAILGTIVRTVPHSQGRAKAGVVASWIALRKDATTPPLSDPNQLITQLETSWAAAVMTNNPDEIGRFLADGFLFVGAGGILQTREAHLDDFRTGTLEGLIRQDQGYPVDRLGWVRGRQHAHVGCRKAGRSRHHGRLSVHGYMAVSEQAMARRGEAANQGRILRSSRKLREWRSPGAVVRGPRPAGRVRGEERWRTAWWSTLRSLNRGLRSRSESALEVAADRLAPGTTSK